ncbi:hypothetical protein [Luteimonas mephitis]|uniref:hypothetical protein n=1 Tax=Luteimonas mephitis TaxID=83615 RepID=UPI003A947D91
MDAKKTPPREPTNAHLPTNNRPRFVHLPRKHPDDATITDNPPEISVVRGEVSPVAHLRV